MKDVFDDANVSNDIELISKQVSKMYVVPGTEKGIDDDGVTLKATQ